MITNTTPTDNRDRLLLYREARDTVDTIALIEWSNPELALNRISTEPARRWPWEKS